MPCNNEVTTLCHLRNKGWWAGFPISPSKAYLQPCIFLLLCFILYRFHAMPLASWMERGAFQHMGDLSYSRYLFDQDWRLGSSRIWLVKASCCIIRWWDRTRHVKESFYLLFIFYVERVYLNLGFQRMRLHEEVEAVGIRHGCWSRSEGSHLKHEAERASLKWCLLTLKTLPQWHTSF